MFKEYGLTTLEILENRISIGEEFSGGGQLDQTDHSNRVFELLTECLIAVGVELPDSAEIDLVKEVCSISSEQALELNKKAEAKNFSEMSPENSFQLQFIGAFAICVAFKTDPQVSNLFENGLKSLEKIQERNNAN